MTAATVESTATATLDTTVSGESGTFSPAVRLTGVGKTFRGGAPVLDGIDLTVAPGEFVCLLGA
ncbi:ABC-type transporter Mla maintaining outer membrane lipid asymmetry ATPase subunit MlaF, partial [Catenulispora sp. MAP12-49]